MRSRRSSGSRGVEGDFESLSRWLRAPQLERSACRRARAPGSQLTRGDALPSLRLREPPWGGLRLGLAPRSAGCGTRIHRAARERRRRTRGGASTSPRVWSERFSRSARRGRLARTRCGAQRRPADPHALARAAAGVRGARRQPRIRRARGGARPGEGARCAQCLPAGRRGSDRHPSRAHWRIRSWSTTASGRRGFTPRYSRNRSSRTPSCRSPPRWLPASQRPALRGASHRRVRCSRPWAARAMSWCCRRRVYYQDLQLLPRPLLAGAALESPGQRSLWLPASLHREGLTESPHRRHRASVGGPPSPCRGEHEESRSAEPVSVSRLRGVAARQHPARERRAGHSSQPARRAAARGAAETVGAAARLALARRVVRRGARGAHRAERRTGGARHPGTSGRPAPPPARFSPTRSWTCSCKCHTALARECRRAARLIRRLCEYERQREPFSVHSLESDAELALAGVRLRMRIDRGRRPRERRPRGPRLQERAALERGLVRRAADASTIARVRASPR